VLVSEGNKLPRCVTGYPAGESGQDADKMKTKKESTDESELAIARVWQEAGQSWKGVAHSLPGACHTVTTISIREHDSRTSRRALRTVISGK
jgi:hypothetical protein